MKPLFEVGHDVVQGFNAHGESHEVGTDAGRELLLLTQLRMRGRRRVNGETLRVTDVGEKAKETQALYETSPRVGTALDTKGNDGTTTLGQVLLLPSMPGTRRETGVPHPRDICVRLKPLRDCRCIRDVALDAKTQGFESLTEGQRI